MKALPRPDSPQTKTACYTSFTFSYLSRAIVLVRTLRSAHPDWAIWAVIVDRAPAGSEWSACLTVFDHVVFADDLGIKDFQSWIFKHNVIEACTAVKGRMLLHMFDRGFEKVVYLDPDIAVFNPMAELEAKLDDFSIILTPHQVEPNQTALAVNDNEMTSFKYGIFNLGFIAVRNDPTGRAFAAWWDGMLYRSCYEAVEQGIYTDQKYCDIVPALFDRVHIERDPGFNVASWNISRRRIRITGNGDILANGSLLKFYHFTKIGGAGDVMTNRYSADNYEISEIRFWYKRQVTAGAMPDIPKSYWHYGAFSNGVSISRAARAAYRSRFEASSPWADPFDVSGESCYEWLRAEARGALPEDGNGDFPDPGFSEKPAPAASFDGSGDPALFDEQWYLKTYTDVAEAVRNGGFSSGRDHYIREGRRGRRMPCFIPVDETFYLSTYADVSAAVAAGTFMSAQDHFEKCGYHEGRLPFLAPARSRR